MKLPENLSKRYTMMTDAEMEGSGQAKDLMKAAMLKRGGRPGAAKMEDSKISKAALRPGVINWDDKKGVWFDVDKAGGDKVTGASHLDLDKLLHSRYVQQEVKQGQEMEEFPDKGASTPVQKEQAKMVANVKSKAAEKVAAVKEAAKVEAKAKALASKAKAAKEAALSGLAGMGFGHLGDQAALDAAHKEMAEAQMAAFEPTCSRGGVVGLPAFQCDPSKMERFVKAQENLAKVAEQLGNEEAMKTAASAAAKAAAAKQTAKQTGGLKLMVGVLAVALIGVVVYLVKKG